MNEHNLRQSGGFVIHFMNKEICFISRPGDGLSYCCFQSEPNPKPMPGMERNGKIIVAEVGKQRFDV
jgi:hypothetical protein